MNSYSQKGFTLIELLVVIAIVGILAGIIIVSMSGATGNANDARRKSDINNISKAILAYQASNGTTPTSSGVWCDLKQDGTGCSNFPSAISKYMPIIPTDPSNTFYRYYSDGNNFALRSTLASGGVYGYSSTSGGYSSTKNLFTLNQGNGGENGATGFSPNINTVISSQGDIYYHGSKSIKVITSGIATTGEGVYFSKVYNIKQNTAYSGSVYLYGTGTLKIGVEEKNSAGSTLTTASAVVTLSNSWQKYTVNFTTAPAIEQLVFVAYTMSQQAGTFYVDEAQLEENPSVTEWTPGT
jgi:type II secretion system protein G